MWLRIRSGWNRIRVDQLTSFQIHSLYFFRCSSLFQDSMPRFTGAKPPGGVQRLRNVEELMANRQALSHAAEVTAWMMLKMIHGFSPWIFPNGCGVLQNGRLSNCRSTDRLAWPFFLLRSSTPFKGGHLTLPSGPMRLLGRTQGFQGRRRSLDSQVPQRLKLCLSKGWDHHAVGLRFQRLNCIKQIV